MSVNPVYVWAMLLLLPAGSLSADPVPVRFTEGSVHGFLVLRSQAGKALASGDLVQVAHGDRVTARLTFRYKDGSVDDESSVFTQHEHFRLISDHHIQKGPAYPKATDVTIRASSGDVTVRYRDKGQEKVETSHLDIDPDVSNGIILDLLKNISPAAKETKVSYLVATPKPRLVKLSITPAGEDRFSVAGLHERAMRFAVKIELGGLEGLLAPLLGKQPANADVWIAGGDAPAFVRYDGPLYLGAPITSIQMSSPVWGPSDYTRH